MSLLENIVSKKNDKYLYSNTEEPKQIYLFEIDIKFVNNKNLIIRKIKNTKIDKLLSLSDNLRYPEISQLKINVIDFNKPINQVTLNIKINKNTNSNYIKNNKINLEISKVTLDMIEINYHILF